jgi:hypothetical protein
MMVGGPGSAPVVLLLVLSLSIPIRGDGKYWWMGSGAFGDGNNIGNIIVNIHLLNNVPKNNKIGDEA